MRNGPLRTFTRRHRWAAAVLLGCVGLVLNLAPMSLSPGVDFVFGGVAVLLAAVALGPLPGLAAGVIAGSRTAWAWGHPWAWIIFSVEALVVGYLAHHRGRRPIVADLVFWVLIGAPMMVVAYSGFLGLSSDLALVIYLKQPVNGLVNAMAVEGLLLIPVLRGALGLPRSPQLRSTLAVVVVASAVVPALAFGVWTGRREWNRNLERTRERVELMAQAHAAQLEQYVRLHEQALRTSSEAVTRRQTWSEEHLDRVVAAERQEFPGFVAVYAVDSRGRVAAASPAVDPRGRTLVGLDVAHREILQGLRTGGGQAVTGVVPGLMPDSRRVLIAHPVVLADTVAGYTLAALDLARLPGPTPRPLGGSRLRVADSKGMLVFDSEDGDPDAAAPSVADSLVFHAVTAVRGAGAITYDSDAHGTAAARTAARHIAGVSHIEELEWWVWVDQPLRAVQAAVSESYVRLLGLLIAVMLLSLAFSDMLARALSRPLLRIRAATGALATGDGAARVGRLPASTPAEIGELARDFDEMATALVGRTAELDELAEIARSLASTLDADEVLRQVTGAAARLVRADGSGIALLTHGGRTLRAGHALGLLAPVAGREFPAEASLIGQVARRGEPVLIDDAASDRRVTLSYLDPEQAGSVICAPLAGRSGPLGTLTAVRARGGERFTLADLGLLERLARQAAIAVENAHLVTRERRRAEESEAIRRIARTVSEVQGLEETLAAVTREAARIVGADGCSVLLLREDAETETMELEVVATAGPSRQRVGDRVAVEGPLLEGPLLRGHPAIIADGTYAAAVPLRVGDEALGVLTADRDGSPFRAEDAGLLAAFADHAAVALRNARLLDAAQAASRAKSDFIATMSHELRTPLNAVLGHLQLLEMEIHGPMTEQQQEAVRRIEAASRHLRGLIEEVLSFARLEAGRVPVRVEETDLCALATEVAAVIEPLAMEKSLRFVLDPCEPHLPVRTDPDKVRQVLINLAGNAVKFTDEGEVRITVRSGDDEAVLSVADTGPGISREDRGRLFRPFEQLASGFSRPHGGTGLGLYLCGRYASMIGGRIEVDSTPGEGSTFSLVLPREAEIAAEWAEAEPAPGAAAE